MPEDPSNQDLIGEIDAVHASISARQLELFELLLEAERREMWRDEGARDMAHWVSIRYGISWWKADRWLKAAHALRGLPRLAHAFSSGRLGVYKVVELARLATSETESRLIGWARGVSVTCIRRKADLAVCRTVEDAQDVDRAGSCPGGTPTKAGAWALRPSSRPPRAPR